MVSRGERTRLQDAWSLVRPVPVGRATALQMERAMLAARWAALGLGLVRLTAYPVDDLAAGLAPLLWTLLGALAIFNVVLDRQLRRGDFSLVRWADGTAPFAVDALVLGAFATAFWDASALGSAWTILLLIVIEAVFRYQLVGILVGPGLALGVQIVATVVSGESADVGQHVYRGGFLLVVAFLGAMLARANAKAREDLRTALAELRDVDRWRQRMVDVLAHDVRAPAGTVVATAQLLGQRDGDLDAETRKELLDSLVRQGTRVQLLAADLLDMSRLDRGTFRVDPAPTELAPVLAGIADSFADSGIEVCLPSTLPARVDARRVEQILANLLTNATRYGAPPIVVTAQRGDDHVRIEVRDHGPGVPAEEHDELFSPFVSGGHAGSTGLGLWIVDELARAHGGHVTYRDADPGASFAVTLPDR